MNGTVLTQVRVVLVDAPRTAGQTIALRIAQLQRSLGEITIGVATGSSPTPVYSSLAALKHQIDPTRISAVALDEYVGLAPQHPESYRNVLIREFCEPLDIPHRNLHIPWVDPHPIRSFEDEIEELGGVDIQLLGIGTNGHIAFNEPGADDSSITRIQPLAPQTRLDNARFFAHPDDVPSECVTQGISTILKAREIHLLAFGKSKAQAVAQMLSGPIDASVPASFLRKHPDVTVYVDTDAASHLGPRL